jgi:DNA-binding GntR family transcriptional regulator
MADIACDFFFWKQPSMVYCMNYAVIIDRFHGDEDMSPKGQPRKSKKSAMYQDVAEQLRQKIYDYELKPGEWIDELELVEKMGISRTPLRESLKLLAAEGLVQIKPGHGCFVTRLTVEDLNELFPIMALLEGRCAHEAARKLTPEGLEQLETLHKQIEQSFSQGDIAGYYQLNYLFHEQIQNLAGNPWLMRVANDLRRILKMHRGRQLLTPGRLEESLAEHRALLDCFRHNDADGAERVMSDHLLHQRTALMNYITAGGSLDVPAPLPHIAKAEIN